MRRQHAWVFVLAVTGLLVPIAVRAGGEGAREGPPVLLTGQATTPSQILVGLTGPANGWVPQATLAEAAAGLSIPTSIVAGRPFTAALTIETATLLSPTMQAGPPMSSGTLVVDLTWVFSSGVTIVQPAAATLTVDHLFQRGTLTITGSVPQPPAVSAEGFTVPLFGPLMATVNADTTAQAQSVNTLVVTIDR